MEPIIPLALELPARGSRARLQSLHLQLRAGILDGRLKAGQRLPSTRALAQACSVSRNTAVAAYDLLLGEGYLLARQGSGTVVAGSLSRSPRPAPIGRLTADRRLNEQWRGAGAAGQRAAGDPPRLIFQLGVPDFAGFPLETWQRLFGRVARRQRAERRLEVEPQGLYGLREAIAQHVSFTRAVACGPNDIVVTSGAQQAFDLLARVLTPAAGAVVAVEDPGYPPLRAAFAAHGARIAAVPVDDEGLVVERLPERARVICVTPSHQFPLGGVMSARRRVALLDFCRRRECVVIEDDYDGEFRFGPRPLDALQTLDRSQSVFYVGTFSKCLSPDLRLGYIAAPPWARDALVAAKRAADGWTGTAAQATLALLIKEGHLRRHVRKMQRLYAERRRVLLQGFNGELGRWLEPLPSLAGLHVTAKLRGAGGEAALVERLRVAGVGVGALHPYYHGTPSMRGLIFGYGNLGTAAIAESLKILLLTIAGTRGRLERQHPPGQ
jgi:GntR family transcriptional regulator / MocR family aminotransferase